MWGFCLEPIGSSRPSSSWVERQGLHEPRGGLTRTDASRGLHPCTPSLLRYLRGRWSDFARGTGAIPGGERHPLSRTPSSAGRRLTRARSVPALSPAPSAPSRCVKRSRPLSPRESSRTVSHVDPKGHRGVFDGGSREYEQAEKAAGARTNAPSTRTDATNSEAPDPKGAEACVNQKTAMFYQTEGMAPHRTPISNGILWLVRESRA